jgi:hypothetical protein
MKLATLELCVNSEVIQPGLSYDRMTRNESRRMFVEAVAVCVNVALNIRLKGLREDTKILNRHSWLLFSIRTGYILDVRYASYRCSQAVHIVAWRVERIQ